jgi:hypothetical protein
LPDGIRDEESFRALEHGPLLRGSWARTNAIPDGEQQDPSLLVSWTGAAARIGEAPPTSSQATERELGLAYGSALTRSAVQP